jgi:hypothetical protein
LLLHATLSLGYEKGHFIVHQIDLACLLVFVMQQPETATLYTRSSTATWDSAGEELGGVATSCSNAIK